MKNALKNKKLFKSMGILAATATALMGSAFAQSNALPDPLNDPRAILPDFDVNTLIPVLEKNGFQWRGSSYESNLGPKNILTVKASNGAIFHLEPKVCRAGVNNGCIGLSMISIFEGDVPQNTLNAFNYAYHFVSVGVDTSNSPFLVRYDIADYGVTIGNIVSSLNSFSNVSQHFKQSVLGAKRTVSNESYSTDMVASFLNNNVLRESSFTSATVALDDTHKLHQQGFGGTAKLVSDLFKAEKLQPGTIANQLEK